MAKRGRPYGSKNKKNDEHDSQDYIPQDSIPMVIEVSRIYPNPEQPRKRFTLKDLEDLSKSIKKHGVITPLAVESFGDDFVLHGGERRLRAAKMAGLATVPCMVYPSLNGNGPQVRLERALVENLQRENMNPIDTGLAFLKLHKEYKYSHRDIARKVSRSEKWVSDMIFLAQESDVEIQSLMRQKLISPQKDVLVALNTIRDRSMRLRAAEKFADNRTTAKGIIAACKAITSNKHITTPSSKKTSKPSKTSATMMLDDVRENPEHFNEWNALSSLGKVPPFPIVNNAVLSTCDNCAIRYMASESTCGTCAMVQMLRLVMVEVIHDKS